MQFYIDVSMEITRLLNKYVPKEAIHVYSIDENFISLDGLSRLWGTPEETIQRIQEDLFRQFQIPSAAALGPNMLISKLALDMQAKKTGFARWTYQDIPEKLWPVSPLSEMWGIGSRLEKSLNNMGIFSVGVLAHADLKALERKFGIMGNQLFHHAWGLDCSLLGSPYIEGQVSYGKGQTLFKDYLKRSEIATIILEISEDIAMRARLARKAGRTIQLSIGYSRNALGGGFSRSQSLHEPTNDTMTIYKTCLQLLDKFHDGRPVRSVSVSLSNVEKESSVQLSLFEKDKWRQRNLGEAMDKLRLKYGHTAILRAVSYTDAGTAIERAKLIGGHKQ
jgi:DNA polymerase V